jgi:hypothetical protein
VTGDHLAMINQPMDVKGEFTPPSMKEEGRTPLMNSGRAVARQWRIVADDFMAAVIPHRQP